MIRHKRKYWTYEKCKEESLKYENRKDFAKNNSKAFHAMYRYNWLDICDHMKIKNIKPRCIYVYEFENHAYIGLTHDLKDRMRRHKESGTVYEYIKETKITPNIIQLTDYIEQTLAQIKEGEFVEKYKNDGWIILNKSKTGSIGSSLLFWTKDLCLEEALKYKNKSDFQKMSKGAYLRSHRNKWLDDICIHMIDGKRKNGFWNYETCKEYSHLCKNKNEFSNKYSGGYNLSKINGWLNDFFPKNKIE